MANNPTVLERLGICLSAMWRLLEWNPRPVSPPMLDPEFEQLGLLPRMVDVCRYRIESLEYALSPCGSLQAWRRFWIRLVLIICIPGICLVPIVLIIVHVISAIIELLVKILTAIAVLAVVVVLFGKYNSKSNHRSK